MIIADVGSFLFHRLTKRRRLLWPEQFLAKTGNNLTIEFKHDVYGRRQTANVNSDFLFFSCNPYINHTKIKVSLTIQCKYKYFDSTAQRAEDRRQKFHFCRLPWTSCLTSLISDVMGAVWFLKIQKPYVPTVNFTCYQKRNNTAHCTHLCYL